MKFLTEASSDELRRLVSGNEFFWLDLTGPTTQQIDALPDFDAEAAERALEYRRTPQLRRFRNHIGMVFYGTTAS